MEPSESPGLLSLDVLLVGDGSCADPICTGLGGLRNFRLYTTPCGDPALATLGERQFDIVILCACKAGRPGLRVLAEGRHLQPGTPFIVFSADQSARTAVAAMQLGAYDFLPWPIDLELLDQHLERIRQHVVMGRKVTRLEQERARLGCCGIVGASAPMRRVYDLVRQVGPTNTTVLLTGETGTGKELVARALHDNSPRRLKSFVPINCGAIPETLIESELFGHVRGSFTGAVCSRQGLVPSAGGGTVFLDDVETLPLSMQSKLLRAIEERRVQPVGGPREVAVDFRLIAATNVDLEAMVQHGQFREDLFYRLSVFPIALPPLRQRRDDVPALVSYYTNLVARELQVPPPAISEGLLAQLVNHDWPGNVRELRNWVERAVILAQGTGIISLPAPQATNGDRPPSLYEHARLGWTLEQLSQDYIRAVLDYTGGHRTRAAEILGIDRRTVYRKAPARSKTLPIAKACQDRSSAS